GCNFKWIWRAKIPLKIQFFLWQLFQDSVLTRDVMNRRGWLGRPVCSFCDEREIS
uniref:Reverse transcriptase zinc-binding domain-containing protein n=1 Tax=Aegilops tauschii subsp. strangulata TaxID=200361 RepID=A0A453T8F4_AEGTS